MYTYGLFLDYVRSVNIPHPSKHQLLKNANVLSGQPLTLYYLGADVHAEDKKGFVPPHDKGSLGLKIIALE